MAEEEVFDGSISRRELLKGAAAGAALAASGGSLYAAERAAASGQGNTQGSDPCDGSRDLIIHNGKFVDYRGLVTDRITVKDGVIVAVGRGKDLGDCTRRINLRGRTVIPGLVDSHAHFTRTGTNPGYETRWIETVFSIAELQQAVADRAAEIPAGAFVTAAGGWNQNQLAEGRLPTLAELDSATSTRAVYLNGRTNTLGAAFFAGFGITTDPVTGQVSSMGGATAALRSVQAFEDKIRGTADAIAFAAATGLTSIHDTSNLTNQPEDYKVMNTLYQQSGRSLDVRMRHYRYFGSTATTDQLRVYMDPIYREVGDETYRINGVGEQIGNADQFMDNLRAAAEAGWRVQQHTLSATDHEHHFADMIMVGQETDVSSLALVARAHPAGDRAADSRAQGGWRRGDDAGLALPERQRRPSVPHGLRQRHPGGGRDRLDERRAAQSVARALLHDDRTESRRRRDKRRADRDAARGARAVHAR
jgi:hypothetical protein